MGQLSASTHTISLNRWSLVFSDPRLEQQFRDHQRRVWGSTELWRLKMNVLAGLINLSITTYLLLLGNVFSQQGANIVLPYMTVAVLHYCISRWHGSSRCTLINHLGEVCYSLICTLSMPTWVLHGDCLEVKVSSFLRKLILGSGVFIGCWCRFLTPTFFRVACVLTPLQFVFQALYLTEPTCNVLLAGPYSTRVLQQLLHFMEQVASWCLHGTTNTSTSIASMDLAHGCQNLLYLMQLFVGGTLLYMQYRMECGNRAVFLQGKGTVAPTWPYVPTLVQVVLHVLVSLQLFAIVWVALHGLNSSSTLLQAISSFELTAA